MNRQQNNEEREKNQVYNEYKNETLCVCMINLLRRCIIFNGSVIRKN